MLYLFIRRMEHENQTANVSRANSPQKYNHSNASENRASENSCVSFSSDAITRYTWQIARIADKLFTFHYQCPSNLYSRPAYQRFFVMAPHCRDKIVSGWSTGIKEPGKGVRRRGTLHWHRWRHLFINIYPRTLMTRRRKKLTNFSERPNEGTCLINSEGWWRKRDCRIAAQQHLPGEPRMSPMIYGTDNSEGWLGNSFVSHKSTR